MEPPAWVCKKLAKVDPYCRIAYSYGDKNLRTGYKQPPYFALIKLLHEKDLERELFRPPEWDRRGPVYSAIGDLKPDWEVNRVPCVIAQLTDDSVGSGTCINLVQDWTIDVRDKQFWHLKKMMREWDESCHAAAMQAVDEAKSHAQHALKVGEQGSNPIIANKFVPKEETAMLAGDYERNLENPYYKELQLLMAPWKAAGWKTPEERDQKPPADFYEPSEGHKAAKKEGVL